MERESSLLDRICEYLDNDDWNYQRRETVVRTAVNARNATFDVYATSAEAMEVMRFYTVYPVKVPEARRIAAMEFVTRANYGLLMGNFEFDLSDGEIRYKTAMDVEGVILSDTAICNLITCGVSMADRYFPGMMKVIFSDMDAAEAIRTVETAEDKGEDEDEDEDKSSEVENEREDDDEGSEAENESEREEKDL